MTFPRRTLATLGLPIVAAAGCCDELDPSPRAVPPHDETGPCTLGHDRG